MIVNPTLAELVSVQEFFGLLRPALIEKDVHVVRALAAIASVDISPFVLVFAGGTSLSRAHRVIQRMSEDIDLKITGEREPRRSELRQIRENITNALLAAGFRFDPTNPQCRISRNTSRYTIFRIPYESITPPDTSLRSQILIEIGVWPLLCPVVTLPVRSFVAEAFGRPAEVADIPCAAIKQTAAEKFVGLTRRVAIETADATSERDPTLVRHIYDLRAIRPHYDPAEVAALAVPIMTHDAAVFGNQFPPYRADPLGETRRALTALRDDANYARSFARLLDDMVYGERIAFGTAMSTLDEVAGHLPAFGLA